MRISLPCVLSAILLAACGGDSSVSGSDEVLTGKGAFSFSSPGNSPAVQVYYYVPEEIGSDAPIVLALHGNDRDASGTRDDWISHADRYGLVVAAPFFSDGAFPNSSGYILGNVFDNGNRVDGQSPKPTNEWAFSVIEPLFDAMKARTGNTSAQYDLVGHSGGAQFGHRFVLFFPDARYRRVVAANAGWYTVPDPAIEFPYGLAASPAAAAPTEGFDRRLTVLLGDRDTDPNSAGLRHNDRADAQGLNRFDRGMHFFERAQTFAAERNRALSWQLDTVEGVGHDRTRMIAAAAERLYE